MVKRERVLTCQASPYPEIVAFSGNEITVKIAFTKPDGPNVGSLFLRMRTATSDYRTSH